MGSEYTGEFEFFSDWLAAYRKQARYSLRELAREAGISHSYAANIEKTAAAPQDMRPRPSQRVVRSIAAVLGADADVGLRLAGWLPRSTTTDDGGITSRERQWMARYRNLPPSRQKLIDRLIDELGSQSDGDDVEI